jgi:hypothetical protein
LILLEMQRSLKDTKEEKKRKQITFDQLKAGRS